MQVGGVDRQHGVPVRHRLLQPPHACQAEGAAVVGPDRRPAAAAANPFAAANCPPLRQLLQQGSVVSQGPLPGPQLAEAEPAGAKRALVPRGGGQQPAQRPHRRLVLALVP